MEEKKHLIVELVRGSEGDCLVMDENRVAGPKPWGGGRVVKKWLLDRRLVEEIVKICKRFLGDAPAEDRWIPVEERLPTKDDANNDGDILAVWVGNKVMSPAPAICSGSCAQYWRYVVQHPDWFSHWMPMPEPPEEG